VPILMVACRAIISGVSGVRDLTSRSFGSVCGGRVGLITTGAGSLCDDFLRADLRSVLGSSILSMVSSKSFCASSVGELGAEPSDSDDMSFPNLSFDAMIAAAGVFVDSRKRWP